MKGPPGEKGIIIEIKLSSEPLKEELNEDFINPNVEAYSLSKVVTQVEVEPESANEAIENGHHIVQNEDDGEVKDLEIIECEKVQEEV